MLRSMSTDLKKGQYLSYLRGSTVGAVQFGGKGKSGQWGGYPSAAGSAEAPQLCITLPIHTSEQNTLCPHGVYELCCRKSSSTGLLPTPPPTPQPPPFLGWGFRAPFPK